MRKPEGAQTTEGQTEARQEAQTVARARPRFFYGWVIVGVMVMGGALSMGMGGLNFGLFIRPVGDELGIGRAIFGWAQTARQVASAFTGPLVGSLLDRFGARVLLAVAATFAIGALLALAHVTHAWQVLACFVILGLVGMNGPGALVLTVPVAKWFVRKRGRAMAFTTLGTPLGGVILVPLSQLFINDFGWRQTWVLLAAMSAVLVIPAALIFLRRQPEDMGLLPDGDAAPTDGAVSQQSLHSSPSRTVSEQSWTRQEAMRSVTLWRLVLVFSIVMLAVSSTGVHRIPYFMDRGLDPGLVAWATALDAAMAGVSAFAMGIMAERLPSRYIGAVAYVVLAAGTLLTIFANSTLNMFLAMGLFGVGVGGLLFLQNYLWAEYFGRRHLGSIRGLVMPITLVFAGAGAPIAGYVRDATGSYNPVWWVGIGFFIVGSLVLATTPPPKRSVGLTRA